MNEAQKKFLLSHPLVIQAQDYAKKAHESIDQRRKYTFDPYIVHPREVARIVAGTSIASMAHGVEMVAAGWLHDVVEDVVRYAGHSLAERERMLMEMKARFGHLVMKYVLEVTNVATMEDGNRNARVAKNLAHLLKASEYGATIKYADVKTNCQDIAANDPNFAVIYLPEKADVLFRVRQGDPILHAEAVKCLIHGMKGLKNVGKQHAGTIRQAIRNLESIG